MFDARREEARDEDEEEEKVLEDDDDFGGCSAKRWCSSPLDVGKDFLRFEKSSVEEEERRDGRERGTKRCEKNARRFFTAKEREEDARRDEEARVVGKVVSVVLSEEEKKSSPRYRWAVGDKELREAMTNGENTVKSTMFTAKKHEFRLSLGNSVVVEGGPAKTFVSAKLECCAPSSSKLSHASNFVDIAATMRVSVEFSGDAEISNDDNKRSIVLREAHTRQVLKTDQSECLVLRNFSSLVRRTIQRSTAQGMKRRRKLKIYFNSSVRWSSILSKRLKAQMITKRISTPLTIQPSSHIAFRYRRSFSSLKISSRKKSANSCESSRKKI